MIDVENKEGCRQAAVSKDTEGMNRREGLAGSLRVLAAAMPRGPVHPYEQEVLGDEAEGQAGPRSRVDSGINFSISTVQPGDPPRAPCSLLTSSLPPTWMPSLRLNHDSESTFVTNDKCESNDRKEDAVTKPKAAVDSQDSGQSRRGRTTVEQDSWRVIMVRRSGPDKQWGVAQKCISECPNITVCPGCLPPAPQYPLSMVFHPALEPDGLTYMNCFKGFLCL